MGETFDAYVLEEQGPAVLRQLSERDLPDAEVTVDVSHSSLNYKDGLAMTGKGKIARRFPMVCGIDLAGTVAESRSPDWHARRRGDRDRLGTVRDLAGRLHQAAAGPAGHAGPQAGCPVARPVDGDRHRRADGHAVRTAARAGGRGPRIRGR